MQDSATEPRTKVKLDIGLKLMGFSGRNTIGSMMRLLELFGVRNRLIKSFSGLCTEN